MAFRLIAEDCAISIYDGGPQSPSGPSYGAAGPVKAFCKSAEVDDRLTTTNVRSIGDTRRKSRGVEGATDIRLRLQQMYSGNPNIALGNYVKFELKAHSSFAVATSYEGILTRNQLTLEQGNEQARTMEIECDAE